MNIHIKAALVVIILYSSSYIGAMDALSLEKSAPVADGVASIKLTKVIELKHVSAQEVVDLLDRMKKTEAECKIGVFAHRGAQIEYLSYSVHPHDEKLLTITASPEAIKRFEIFFTAFVDIDISATETNPILMYEKEMNEVDKLGKYDVKDRVSSATYPAKRSQLPDLYSSLPLCIEPSEGGR